MKLLLLFTALISSVMAYGSTKQDSIFNSTRQTVYKRTVGEIRSKSFAITTKFWFDGDILFTECGSCVLRESSRRTKKKKTTVIFSNVQEGKISQVKIIWKGNNITAIYLYAPDKTTSIGYF